MRARMKYSPDWKLSIRIWINLKTDDLRSNNRILRFKFYLGRCQFDFDQEYIDNISNTCCQQPKWLYDRFHWFWCLKVMKKGKKSINLTWVYENSSPVTEFITSPIVITIYCGNITKILIVFPRASSLYLILHFSPFSSTLKRSSIQKNQHVNLISNYKGSKVHNL